MHLRNYFTSEINETANSVKAAWNIIHGLSGTVHKHENTKVLKEDSNTINDPNKTAELFNNFFVELVGNIICQITVNN